MPNDDSNAPATKGDIQILKEEFAEALEGTETKLLTAFYPWARVSDLKHRALQREVQTGFLRFTEAIVKLAENQNELTKAQKELAEAQKELTEQHKQTEANLGALILTVDEIIRKQK